MVCFMSRWGVAVVVMKNCDLFESGSPMFAIDTVNGSWVNLHNIINTPKSVAVEKVQENLQEHPTLTTMISQMKKTSRFKFHMGVCSRVNFKILRLDLPNNAWIEFFLGAWSRRLQIILNSLGNFASNQIITSKCKYSPLGSKSVNPSWHGFYNINNNKKQVPTWICFTFWRKFWWWKFKTYPSLNSSLKLLPQIDSPPVPSPFGSPVWIMKSLITRWNSNPS